jgi:hypothetical protein
MMRWRGAVPRRVCEARVGLRSLDLSLAVMNRVVTDSRAIPEPPDRALSTGKCEEQRAAQL